MNELQKVGPGAVTDQEKEACVTMWWRGSYRQPNHPRSRRHTDASNDGSREHGGLGDFISGGVGHDQGSSESVCGEESRV